MESCSGGLQARPMLVQCFSFSYDITSLAALCAAALCKLLPLLRNNTKYVVEGGGGEGGEMQLCNYC